LLSKEVKKVYVSVKLGRRGEEVNTATLWFFTHFLFQIEEDIPTECVTNVEGSGDSRSLAIMHCFQDFHCFEKLLRSKQQRNVRECLPISPPVT
jgi:hypothetical protein